MNASLQGLSLPSLRIGGRARLFLARIYTSWRRLARNNKKKSPVSPAVRPHRREKSPTGRQATETTGMRHRERETPWRCVEMQGELKTRKRRLADRAAGKGPVVKSCKPDSALGGVELLRYRYSAAWRDSFSITKSPGWALALTRTDYPPTTSAAIVAANAAPRRLAVAAVTVSGR